MKPGHLHLLLLGIVGTTIGLRVTRPEAPPVAAVRAGHQPSDARLLDRHGELLHERRTDPTRRRLAWVPLDAVSPALVAAVVAAEDHRFHRHGGVDGRALAAAALAPVRGDPPRGGSTITMQVATLVEPSLHRRRGSRSLGRKWRQMRLAWALERRWSKDEILEAYLNLATFRGELEGVGAASEVLFGKAPHGLDATEATVLAVLLQSPNASGDAITRRAGRLAARTASPLDAAALATGVRHATAPAGRAPLTLAPHVARRLQPGPGVQPTRRTTLDGALQRAARTALRENLLAVQGRGVEDGAVLVLDNQSGDVLAYVGSSGDLSRTPHVDGVQARRQPGSALKPFLYGLALELRLVTPASLVDDSPLALPVSGGLYRPRNYDDVHHGPVSVRTALAASLNVPAVRTLGLVGVEAFRQRLRDLGFAGLVRDGEHYGPALALGAAEVSLWELTNAFRTLADGGVWSPIRLDPNARPDGPRQVMALGSAFLVGTILSDRESRSATFGLENVLATRVWTAAKTGTSKEMRDNWCVGWSQRFTVGVWVGNFSGAPMRDVSGVTGAAPVWAEVMAFLHRDVPSAAPSPPRDVVERAVGTGDRVRREWFLAGTEPPAAGFAPAPPRPRIRTPVAGMRIALDPDIPAGRQRLLLDAEDGGASLRWTLDGNDLGDAERRLWEPTPGRHRLALVDAERRVLDSVDFEVRGRVRP